VKVTTVSWGSENSWTLGDCSGSGFEDNQEYDSVCCLTGGEHTLTCSDTYGDGWHGGFIEVDGVTYCNEFSKGMEETSSVWVYGQCPEIDSSTVPYGQ
jgi:hypothetical protein